ncbi:MAG: hypothetical protein IKO06_02315 [Alphaproteobacteria bacterium]|nr:hypothetical protein [Alphaproteobacteria bacterium]
MNAVQAKLEKMVFVLLIPVIVEMGILKNMSVMPEVTLFMLVFLIVV